MDFVFMDNDDIKNPDSRHTIRSRVMRGKNSGRVLPKRQPKQASHSDIKFVFWHENRSKKAPRLPRQIGNELSGLANGGKMSTIDKAYGYTNLYRYMYHAYPSHICAPRTEDFWWFESFFTHEAFFHGWVASSMLVENFAYGNKRNAGGDDYTRHIVNALRLVNHDISANRDVSDVAIACVLLLCCNSIMTGSPEQAKIHFDGLVRMVQIRGGLQELKKDKYLVLKAQIFDISLVFELGCNARLKKQIKPIDEIVPFSIDTSPMIESPLLILIWDGPKELYEAAVEMFKLSHLFNSRKDKTKLTTLQYMETTVHIRYRLMNMYENGESRFQDPIAAAIHLGLLASAMSFDSFFNPEAGAFDRFFDSLKAALSNPAFQATVDVDTHLWLLMTTAISVAGPQGRAYLAPIIIRTAAKYEMRDWAFIRQVLGAYPWVGSLHDRLASEYWVTILDQMGRM